MPPLCVVCITEKIPFRLMVVHVNHKIRNEAGEDAAYVQKLCEILQVPFFLYEKMWSRLPAGKAFLRKKPAETSAMKPSGKC